MRDHEYYMEIALTQARHALEIGEIPVGAVVVDSNGDIVGYGCNETLSAHDPSAHAEMVALRRAALTLKNYRLPFSPANDLTSKNFGQILFCPNSRQIRIFL